MLRLDLYDCNHLFGVVRRLAIILTCAFASAVPQIATVTTTSNSYNSIQLTVTLLHTGGRPVTEFLIRYKAVYTFSWKSLTVAAKHTNANISWNYTLIHLQYDHHGYVVEISAVNSVGQSNAFAFSPIKLFTGSQNS